MNTLNALKTVFRIRALTVFLIVVGVPGLATVSRSAEDSPMKPLESSIIVPLADEYAKDYITRFNIPRARRNGEIPYSMVNNRQPWEINAPIIGYGEMSGISSTTPNAWNTRMIFFVFDSVEEARKHAGCEFSNVKNDGWRPEWGSFSGVPIGDACGAWNGHFANLKLGFLRYNITARIYADIPDGKNHQVMEPEIEEALEATARIIVKKIDAVVAAKGKVDMSNLPPIWKPEPPPPPSFGDRVARTVRNTAEAIEPATPVSRETLYSLLPLPSELPADALLGAYFPPPHGKAYRYDTMPGDSIADARWLLTPRPEGGSSGGITVSIAVAASPEEAVSITLDEIKTGKEVIPEITGQPVAKGFSDRAWFFDESGPNHKTARAFLLFTKANVAVTVIDDRVQPFDGTEVFSLASAIGKRIDAVVSGNPLPAPVMPVSLSDLGIGLREAWDGPYRPVLQGKPVNTIIIKFAQEPPRAIPAAEMPDGGYLVPLSALPSPRLLEAKPWADPQAAGTLRARLNGVAYRFTPGQAVARKGEDAVTMAHPAEMRHGLLWVPLSFVETALSRPITWTTHQGKKMARF